MKEPKSIARELSACETLLMKIVWDTPEDIAVQKLITEVKTRFGKDYARTTVVTFLHSMTQKGYVKTYRKGKASFVHALKNEDNYKNQLVKEEASFWFNGQPSKVMSALISDGDISKEEIERLRQMIDALE